MNHTGRYTWPSVVSPSRCLRIFLHPFCISDARLAVHPIYHDWPFKRIGVGLCQHSDFFRCGKLFRNVRSRWMCREEHHGRIRRLAWMEIGHDCAQLSWVRGRFHGFELKLEWLALPSVCRIRSRQGSSKHFQSLIGDDLPKVSERFELCKTFKPHSQNSDFGLFVHAN